MIAAIPLKNTSVPNTLNSKVKDLLSDKEKEVYNLLLQGMDYQEIEINLNKTPKQVDNTIQRIRLKLKNLD